MWLIVDAQTLKPSHSLTFLNGLNDLISWQPAVDLRLGGPSDLKETISHFYQSCTNSLSRIATSYGVCGLQALMNRSILAMSTSKRAWPRRIIDSKLGQYWMDVALGSLGSWLPL